MLTEGKTCTISSALHVLLNLFWISTEDDLALCVIFNAENSAGVFGAIHTHEINSKLKMVDEDE